MKRFIKDMLTNGTGVSSKRVNGTLGWLLCSFIFVYSAISKNIGDFHLLYISLTAGLLGLDSVLKTFKKNENENNKRRN